MKTTIYTAVFAFFVMLWLSSCKTQQMPVYVPVETVKTEYRDNYIHDSVVRYDSVFVKEKGDTVIFERYKYLYKDRLVRDSVVIRDSIQVPYPVEVSVPVNYITGWQNFQIWLGRSLLLFVFVYLIVLYFKKR
ncbi:hypothetical protein AGMMS49965_09750 [Bacteroidia bacterium]|nr:hypothetical protein AGMMS49965_09750 [Bacteroidia bacterium]